jgi:hypothetical protein
VFLFAEILTNVAMTFLITALILFVVKKDREKPRRVYRYVIAVLFGIGLMTKFLIIPLMGAYYGHKADWKNRRALATIAVDSAVALATAVVLMAPFGVTAVLKNTILFNLVLKDRAVYTTFFPNVLSGPMTWLGLQTLYPAAALAVLAAAVLAAPKLDLPLALMTASTAFLFVTATPEPQYIPVMLYLALFSVHWGTAAEVRVAARRRKVVRGGPPVPAYEN